ncbi:hypothetical protein L210DRAFT_3052742 [Boletus edulis BED1]|uniref:Uncharacterized protein n=1 Tax=Boletus edulis BED1 TaxID=1328754 RepID=A0AAD4GHD6_BOLED|nr:hypothetical protein L210DRAFT_3052742 [Boletus edulis BED1]
MASYFCMFLANVFISPDIRYTWPMRCIHAPHGTLPVPRYARMFDPPSFCSHFAPVVYSCHPPPPFVITMSRCPFFLSTATSRLLLC